MKKHEWVPVHGHTSPIDGGVIVRPDSSGGGAGSSGSSGSTYSVAGGDLSGTYPSPTVAKINGSPLGATTGGSAGDRLRFDGTNWLDSSLIWRPSMVLDPTSGNYLPVTTGSGDAVMVEA